MKYILKQNNYYSHVGTDPVENAIPLDFDQNFSLSKLPTQFHYWNGEEFVLDEAMYKSSLINQAKEIVCKLCDELQIKITKNESYMYEDNYQEKKDSLLQQVKMQRARFTTFSALSIAELEQIISETK